jgi:sulfite exporter TauE/SafE
MTVNVGMLDRIARVVVGIALIAFALGYIAPGTSWSWVGWIGVVPILTAIFSSCPTYSLLGISTK